MKKAIIVLTLMMAALPLIADDSDVAFSVSGRNSCCAVFGPRTTTQRDLLSMPAGAVLFNATTSRLNVFDGSAWQSFALLSGDTFIGNVGVSGGFSVTQTSANGAQWVRGTSSELLTLSTSGATTDTSANLLPANSVIEAVVARVTTTITTATDWKLGDGSTAGRFSAADTTMTANETVVGLVHVDVTGAGGPRQTSAAKVRVTTTGTPGAGAIRITVFYRQFVAPTS